MNIHTVGSSFTISVYVREHTLGDYTLLITNKASQQTTTKVVSGSYSDGLLTLTDVNYPIEEGRTYFLKIYSLAGIEIYKGQIFCTAQTDYESFKVLNDYYTVVTKDDTAFIVKGEFLPNILYAENDTILQMEDGSNMQLEH